MHYQSLQIIVLFVQACLLAGLALSRTLLRKGKQRQAYTDPQCGFCGCVELSKSSYSFALTSMSFRDLPLLSDMIGGILKMFSAEAGFL